MGTAKTRSQECERCTHECARTLAWLEPVPCGVNSAAQVLFVLPAIPGQRAPQPLLERVPRIVAEIATCRGRVGLRIPHIPCASGRIRRPNFHTLDLLQRPPHLVERIPVAVAGVIDLA